MSLSVQIFRLTLLFSIIGVGRVLCKIRATVLMLIDVISQQMGGSFKELLLSSLGCPMNNI